MQWLPVASRPECGRSIRDVEQRFVGRERKPVGLDRYVGDRLDFAIRRIEAKDVAIADLGFAAVPFLGNDEAVGRVGEPDRAVGLDHDVVRRIEALALPAIDDDALLLPADVRAEHRAKAVRAVQDRSVEVARVAVREFDPVAEHAHAVACRPAQHAVVRYVAPENAVVLANPHRAFAPDRAGAQALERTGAAHDRCEALVEDLDTHSSAPRAGILIRIFTLSPRVGRSRTRAIAPPSLRSARSLTPP